LGKIDIPSRLTKGIEMARGMVRARASGGEVVYGYSLSVPGSGDPPLQAEHAFAALNIFARGGFLHRAGHSASTKDEEPKRDQVLNLLRQWSEQDVAADDPDFEKDLAELKSRHLRFHSRD
jgi:hypothetical protein